MPNWLSTVTGRVGYALNQILVYGKGGIAFTNESNNIKIPPGVYIPPGAPGVDPVGSTVGNQSIALGWTIGAGARICVRPALVAAIRIRLSDFSSHSFGFGGTSSTY